MNRYLDVFIDPDYPNFIDRYLNTLTMQRLKHVTQFCGCDYTTLYSPLFKFTRFDHSLVVAHMTWHFSHDRKETIIALLHDVGTPCFAHCIDYVFGGYLKQESSEKNVWSMLKQDNEILGFLKEDNINKEDFYDFSKYPILENKSPRLCTDRLDGVLHTCYIWLHTNSIEEVKEIYDDLIVLKNEEGNFEIGFKNISVAEKFVKMVYTYALELQRNEDKYVSKYISEIVKAAVRKKLISLEDLYNKKESEICNIFDENFTSWKKFNVFEKLIRTEEEPKNIFYISFDTKKRNVIPLISTEEGNKRIDEVSFLAKNLYDELTNYKDSKYAYVEEIENI